MTFLESLLGLLLVAILLLQVARRLSLPYPSMLALAGIAVALVPGAPTLPIDPETALALFIAPALMDSAFDFPIDTMHRFRAPLLAFAVGGVVVTASLVAVAAWAIAGLPLAAAFTLGAIVAPPDAAAATAILTAMAIPRSTDAVLRGESLFNDASALLLFGAALAIERAGGLSATVGVELLLAVPGGVLFGFVAALLMRRVNAAVAGTLGGNLLQFVATLLIWIVAERLDLSPVMAIVAFAMTAARGALRQGARMRVHSYAVWSAVVFVLNVIAFLLMGMQARVIVGDMASGHLRDAAVLAGIVVAIVVVSRMLFAVCVNRAFAWVRRLRGQSELASVRQATIAGWCGMRGLVTLATAFALPASFPQRDAVVLAAFAVVIATLVFQGMTLAPLIRLLGLDRHAHGADELADVRRELAAAALAVLDGAPEGEAEPLRAMYRIEHGALASHDGAALDRYRALAMRAVEAQRDVLEAVRRDHRVNADEYNRLLEDIDWRELVALPDERRAIEES